MVDYIFARAFLFFIEAIGFGTLTFFFAIFYRGYQRQYIKLWVISFGALSLYLLATALQSGQPTQVATSIEQVAYSLVRQTAHYVFWAFLLLGSWVSQRRSELSLRFIRQLIFIIIVFSACVVLLFAFDEKEVFNRFYLRKSLSSFIFSISLFVTSFYLFTSSHQHFSSKALKVFTLIMGVRYLLFSFASIVALTEYWFIQFTQLLFFFDLGSYTILAFIVLIWVQGAERHLAKSAIKEVKYFNKHDSLKGSMNREQILEKLPDVIEKATRSSLKLGVFLLDIKRFKFVNDSYGLKAGDAILSEIVRRLNQSILMPVVVGRTSGDSFIFTVEIAKESESQRITEHIHALIARPFQCDEQEVHLQCGIGYCLFPNDGDDAETLLQNAHLALFNTKNQNCSSTQFSAEMETKGRRLAEVETEIKTAFNKDEFVLFFQPQLNLFNNRLEGVEALIRWQHPSKGLLPPAAFLDDIEQLGLNSQLDNYVLNKACKTIARWHKTYHRFITVAVNLSAAEFQDPRLVAKIQALLIENAISPQALELEITENVMITDMHQAMNTIVALQSMGVKISIDDFGTGYSSLSYLRKLPIDKIKIDRSFIMEVDSNDSDLTIVKSIIELSHGLGKRVLAEGVETEKQLQLLRNLSCDAVQGFFISKPVPEVELVKYLKRK
jgi:diguanylate cyclase (GGDEF)-like protein